MVPSQVRGAMRPADTTGAAGAGLPGAERFKEVKGMKKRIVGTLMALLLAVTVLPPGAISVTSADVTTGLVTTAYAAEHQNHCICGATHKTIGDHTSEVKPETWTGVSSLDEITKDGYYYLTKNVELSNSAWEPDYNYGNNYGYGNNVVLCLNGYSITQSDVEAVLEVSKRCTLTLTDCAAEGQQGEIKHVVDPRTNTVHYNHGVYVTYGTFNMYGGRITGNTSGYVDSSNSPVAGEGGGVYVGDGYSSSSNAVFNMYGGTITGNKADQGGKGGGVYVQSGRTFNMYGGTISNNTADYGGGVYVEEGATFTMSGDANITANTAGTTTRGFGGGVYSKGTFNLNGGTITENTAISDGFTRELGGGVNSAGGKLNLSGNPVVKDNKKDTSSDNVKVDGGTMEVTAALTEGAEIVLNSLNGATITGDSAYYTRTDKNDGSVALTAPTGSSGGETGGETTEHKHCVCGTGTLGHTHDASVTWTAINTKAELKDATAGGHYYLAADIDMGSDYWAVPNNAVLCLNGKTLTIYNGIVVREGQTFTLTDCKPDGHEGSVSWSQSNSGEPGVELIKNAHFVMYGGRIERFNTGVELSHEGTTTSFTMYGGMIDGKICGVSVKINSVAAILGGKVNCDYAGVQVYGGQLTIGGNTVITGKESDVKLEPYNDTFFPIAVNEDFTGEFGVTAGYFVKDGTQIINGSGYTGTITCDNVGKEIDKNGNLATKTSTNIPVTGVTMDKNTASVEANKTVTLTATVAPDNATNKAVAWNSSDTTVATVANGTVTGVKEGKAIITVTTVDGNFTATCEVTVTAAQPGHVHVKGERTYDENGHWFKCTGCNEKLEYAVHQLDADGKCECGYVKQGDTPTPPTPTPEAPRYYYSSGSGSTGAGGLSAVQNDPNGKSATDYNGGIYGLIFKSYANFSSFQGVQVDGVTIGAANYSVEGNEVYLKAVYLQTLANGKHTLTVLSGEGDATAQFTVGGVVSAPKTADAGALAYLGLALSSYVGTALVTRRKKEF